MLEAEMPPGFAQMLTVDLSATPCKLSDSAPIKRHNTDRPA
jgi:hypothetical protein